MGDFEERINKLKDKLYQLKDNKKIIIIASIIAISIGAIFLTINLTEPKEEVKSAPAEEEKTEQKASTKSYVDVDGEVKCPGVYEISSQSRIYDAIKLAGGLTENADTTAINQAEKVEDGQKVVIPAKDEQGQEGESNADRSGGGQAKTNGKININTADATALQEIPGIGPSKAEKIITYRDTNGKFKSVDEITNVSGIGQKTFESIKDYITI